MQIVNQTDIEKLLELDPVFDLIHKTYGTPPNWTRPQGFETLCKIILEQQVSLESANAHFQKLKSKIKLFKPENIALLSIPELREAQISRQKSTYLIGLSQAILNGDLDLDTFSKMEEEAIRNKLTAIKGIGKWTSDIYLLFCLQAKDIMPLGDIAVVNTIKELKGVENDKLDEISSVWKPLRSLATFFLWHYYLKKRNRSAEEYI